MVVKRHLIKHTSMSSKLANIQKKMDTVEEMIKNQKKMDMVAERVSRHNKMFIEVIYTKDIKKDEKKAVVMMKRLFELEEAFEIICKRNGEPELFEKFKKESLMNKYC